MNASAILYHGTNQIIDAPKWNLGSRFRDFGQCFYTTYSRNMAKDWARKKYKSLGTVNLYVFDLSIAGSGNLSIKRFDANEEWARFIYENRYNKDFIRPDYDIIIGPLADNQLKEQFNKIKTEGKTFEEIAALIEYRKYTDYQVCFCSDYAISLLRKM